MKPRRVVIIVEVESTEPIKELKNAAKFGLNYETDLGSTKIIQIQANVIQEGSKTSKHSLDHE